MAYRLQCCGCYIYFFAKAECRNFLPEDYNKKIKQQLRGGKEIPYKNYSSFIFIFLPYLLPLLQVDAFMLTTVSAGIRPCITKNSFQSLTRMYHYTAIESP